MKRVIVLLLSTRSSQNCTLKFLDGRKYHFIVGAAHDYQFWRHNERWALMNLWFSENITARKRLKCCVNGNIKREITLILISRARRSNLYGVLGNYTENQWKFLNCTAHAPAIYFHFYRTYFMLLLTHHQHELLEVEVNLALYFDIQSHTDDS